MTKHAETVVYHLGMMWKGPDALNRALDGDEPDDWIEVEDDPDDPPRLLTTIRPYTILGEAVAIMEFWTRRYPRAVMRTDTGAMEIWSKPLPRPKPPAVPARISRRALRWRRARRRAAR